jgi:hypothetical protein
MLEAAAATIAVPASALVQIGMAQAQDGSAMRLKLNFADQDFIATLEDNPSARDVYSMMPLDLTISDSSTNEKFAYPAAQAERGEERPLRQRGSR